MPFSRYEACLGTKTVLTTIRDDLIDPSLLPSGPVVSSVASSSSRRPSTSPPAADPEHAAQGTGEYPEPPTSFQAVMAPRPYPPASYARFLLPAPALEAEMTPERPSISRSRSRSPSPAAQKRRKVSEEPPKTGGNSYQYRCYNCQETFSKRYTISSRHFVACVRDRGLPDGVFWDSDPSCWELGSNGPSGKPVRGVEVAKAYHARNQGKVRNNEITRNKQKGETDTAV